MKELTGEVVLIADDERSRNYMWFDNSEKLSSNLQIVPVSEARNYQNQLCLTSQPESGMMLIRHPYESRYISANNYQDEIIKHKMRAIRKVSQCLGAKKVEYSWLFNQEGTREFDAEGNLKIKVVNIEGSYKERQETKCRDSYKRFDTFEGVYSEADWNEARKVASEMGLDRDPDIVDLIESRKPGLANKQTSYRVEINSTRETNERMDIAFSVTILKGVFKLGGGVHEVITSSQEISLICDVQF